MPVALRYLPAPRVPTVCRRAADPSGRRRSGALCFTTREVRRLSLPRWPFFPAGLRGPSWATSGREHADQPARDGGKDRGKRVRDRGPVVDERRPGDATNDEVQAKGRHDRDIRQSGRPLGRRCSCICITSMSLGSSRQCAPTCAACDSSIATSGTLTPCSQSQIGPCCHLRGWGTAQVGAAS